MAVVKMLRNIGLEDARLMNLDRTVTREGQLVEVDQETRDELILRGYAEEEKEEGVADEEFEQRRLQEQRKLQEERQVRQQREFDERQKGEEQQEHPEQQRQAEQQRRQQEQQRQVEQQRRQQVTSRPPPPPTPPRQ